MGNKYLKQVFWEMPFIEIILGILLYLGIAFALSFMPENWDYNPMLPVYLWLLVIGMPTFLYFYRINMLNKLIQE